MEPRGSMLHSQGLSNKFCPEPNQPNSSYFKIHCILIGLIQLRIGIFAEPLWMWHWASGFHKPWNWFIFYYLTTNPRKWIKNTFLRNKKWWDTQYRNQETIAKSRTLLNISKKDDLTGKNMWANGSQTTFEIELNKTIDEKRGREKPAMKWIENGSTSSGKAIEIYIL